MSLLNSLSKQLREQGEMPFADFMQHALYHPHYGYYSAGLQKFGRHGDFITAPELTPLFGYTLANQFQHVLTEIDEPIIFEFGAGSGRLCIDVLTRLEQLNTLPEEYHILEVSSNLRVRQQEAIQEAIPHIAHHVKWLSSWPEQSFNGLIIANEVLDAMPVHRFIKTAEGILECFIGLDGENQLCEQYKPSVNTRLITHVEKIIAAELYPYQSEVNLFLEGWLQQAYNMLNKGAFFLLDYGFPRQEYYHPDRSMGTLMCHYRHQAHHNPLAHPGEEDITAHVDFTHVAEAASEAGFHVAGFTNQASFLLGNDLLGFISELTDERDAFAKKQAVKQLLQENEMGELFKVMALTKNLDLTLTGFALQDRRFSL